MPTKYSVVNQFKGYINKPDITNVEPGYLVVGSQNVLLNDGERVALRKGYTLDGDVATGDYPIASSFDWQTHLGTERNLRAFDDGDETLQYRYVASDGTVTWRDLITTLDSVSLNFAVFWDNSELIERLLFVDGSSNIYDWSGAVTTMASATANTITKNGTATWAEDGFYTAGTRRVVINGTAYTYTGGEGTDTLTGVTPDPSGEAADSIVHQQVRTTANSSITNLPNAFPNALIDVLNNQIWIGSLTSNQVYVSIQNSLTDFTQASPRTPGSGALITIDAPPTAFVAQEEFMYISAGRDFWYQIGFQLSADNAAEAVSVNRLKTTSLQAAMSQAMVTKIKNDVAFISFEPSFDTLGRIELVETPQTVDISDSIKLDFDNYNYTNASTFYDRNFIYIALPSEGIVRMFNQAKGYWEAPQVLPIRRFAVIGGALYGHSSQSNETYRLFSGTSDNENPIKAVAAFSYMNGGTRANLKAMTEWFSEGYLSQNTTLKLTLNYEFEGSVARPSYTLPNSGNYIFNRTTDGSLGKNSLGKYSLAGRGATEDGVLPPKFRVFTAFSETDFYEVQPVYESDQADASWELLAIGSDMKQSTSGNNNITT